MVYESDEQQAIEFVEQAAEEILKEINDEFDDEHPDVKTAIK